VGDAGHRLLHRRPDRRTCQRHADDIAARTEARAQHTVEEIRTLAQAAAEAPRAASQLMVELRQQLSDSLARDNAVLDERRRLMATLDRVLADVHQTANDQRAAIDARVASSTEVLAQAGTRVVDLVDAQAGRTAEVAAQLTGSAVEVASLGEAFGAAVEQFSASNERLGAHLQRVEEALGRSLSRSDEQLAYYVAQAREVIDLSITSQRQIVEDLERLARQRATAGSEA
jgi:hypothetical protein